MRHGITGHVSCHNEFPIFCNRNIPFGDTLGLVQRNHQKRNGRKSKVTAVLSVLFLSTSVTGIILLDVNEANPQIGLSHYKIGIAMSLLSIGHILKRLPVLRKSMKIGRL